MTEKEATERYFETVIGNIIDQQIALDIYASGKSAESLTYNVDDKGNGRMVGESYIYYQVHGRGPGKMPPIDNIKAWVEVKQLELSPWAVAYKIARDGTAIWRGDRQGLDLQKAYVAGKTQLLKDLAKAKAEEIRKEVSAAIAKNKKRK